MLAGVEGQQRAEARARVARAGVAARGPLGGVEPGAWQDLLEEGVTEGHAVLGPGPPEEVADVEALKSLTIEPEHPFDLRHGGPLEGRRLPAPVEQPRVAVALIHEPQTPDAPRASPEDVGGLQPGELP